MNNYYLEFEKHLMEDEKPSEYFNELIDSGTYPSKHPFTMISDLIKTEQNLEYHPEGSVWNHTMMVVDEAAKRKNNSENPRVFMWAALLHDIGKGPTTKVRKGKITSYDHDEVGERMAREFLEFFEEDKEFVNEVAGLVRWHMQILFVVKELPWQDVEKMNEETSIDEIALLGKCDRMGRGDMNKSNIEKEEKNVKIFLEKSKKKLRNKARK
ncbi:HDIG domain-containing metalloprotein [Clostridium sp.]|uniref:HDIG domain-containing metalloprotein n=1 Tax=Clostridium sp. TaxID=1506 RepID=UPI002FC75363